tara:strand:+ start:375 stop:635 length:261 start_codon:yes stop_codon:yes gene_type:complete
MSSSDYNGTWVNGIRYSLGAQRFAGQTRDKSQPDGTILRTTYGTIIVAGTKLVATISERVKVGFVVPKKPDYIVKMLEQAAWENGY